MTQQSSFGYEFMGQPRRPLRVVDDHGPVGQGASAARHVLAENGSEYIIKGPSLTPGHRYVAANEYIAACLADTLGLPILDYRIVVMKGELFFASSWMAKGSFYSGTTEDLFDLCSNRDKVYDLVVFDVWICNVDRHAGNLLVRRLQGRGGNERHLLLLNDHSHCLVIPGETPSHLANKLDSPPQQYVILDFVRNAIKDAARLSSALDTVRALDSNTLKSTVQSVPDAFLRDEEKGAYEDFLLARKDRLRTIFMNGLNCFSRLQGGAL
jgi:hypothetical protein